MSEGDFELRVGKTRGVSPPLGRTYFNSVINAAARVGEPIGVRRPARRPFDGRLISRGTVASRMLAMPGRYAGLRARRATVFVRVVRHRSNAMRAAKRHLRYLERGAFTRDGEEGSLYSAKEERVHAGQFLEPCGDDRHHFRIIASAEDATEYEELRPLIRRFMVSMEEDLGTRLDWVAADHFNTAHPHTHVFVRGKDEAGEDLIISPLYMNGGMRDRLAEIVSIDLGPPTSPEIDRRRSLDLVDNEQLTRVDRKLFAEMDEERVVAAVGRDTLDRAVRTGRLRKLASLGLAQDLGRGRWRLSPQTEAILRELGERPAIEQRLKEAMRAAGVELGSRQVVIDGADSQAVSIGRLLARGFADELHDRQYIVIDGTDGRCHYLEIAANEVVARMPALSLVRVGPEAGGAAPARVELLSGIPLDHLADYDGPTWLDQELVTRTTHLRDSGFGRDVRKALERRRSWLTEQGLASTIGNRFAWRSDIFAVLEHRELERESESIARETGLKFEPARVGSTIEGVVRRRFHLASSRFAMIETGMGFTLVPWQRELERAGDRAISGLVTPGGIRWTLARERGLSL